MSRLLCLLGLHRWLETSERWEWIGMGRVFVVRYRCSRCPRAASRLS